MGTILYTILIKPLELIFELIFSISHDIVPNPAVNLVIMSLAINLLVLPLYRRADVIQQESRDTENRLRPVMDHIKKTFKGDEKVMMLQTYYRQQSYSPLSSMKSIISLVLQIPFFIAAYNFLSHLALLDGQSMGPISDLAKPDGLIAVGSISINLLPILMTVINIISSEIYTKGQPFKDKIVLYLSAAIFLVLLYDSPSGLVFYWTFNNVFALVKNALVKLSIPILVFKAVCALSGCVLIILCISFWSKIESELMAFLLTICGVMVVPLICHFTGNIRWVDKKAKNKNSCIGLFWVSSSYLMVLVGLLIPSGVIASCPEDFISIAHPLNPLHYLFHSVLMSFGIFVIWLGIYFVLSSSAVRTAFSFIVFSIAIIATVDYMCFGIDKKGMMTTGFVFDYWLRPDSELKLISSVAAVVIVVISFLLIRYFPKLPTFLVTVGLVSICAMSAMNAHNTEECYKRYVSDTNHIELPQIQLSRTGKNVVILMMDRAVGALVPYIFNEKSELYKKYDGFTYYPNTISHGIATNFGSPALYGGYEYTVEKMNERDDLLLKDKHNEALLLLPTIFLNEGYNATTIDPPYANYSEIGDLSIFESRGINAYHSNGLFNDHGEIAFEQMKALRERNFICYSLFKISPPLFKGLIYDDGNYHNLGTTVAESSEYTFPQKVIGSLSIAQGVDVSFMDAFTSLEAMSACTMVMDSDEDCFVMIDNTVPHCTMILQKPDYIISQKVDNTLYDNNNDSMEINGRRLNLNGYIRLGVYHTNMASYLCLAEWFDYLRSNGVWDNTRIILVSDHGYECGHFEELYIDDMGIDAEAFNPVLMVKDFNSKGFSVSEEFMTNADVPVIAMEGIIDDPINPFTGNLINSNDKIEHPQRLLYSDNRWISVNNGTRFAPGNWYTVHGNIFDKSNWEYLGEY